MKSNLKYAIMLVVGCFLGVGAGLSAFIVQQTEKNSLDVALSKTSEPVCHIGDLEFVTLDRALEYASNDAESNEIWVYVRTNPTMEESHSLSSEDTLLIPYLDPDGSVSSSDLTSDEEIGIRKWGEGGGTNDISKFSCTSCVSLNADLTVYGTVKIGAVCSTPSHPYQGFIQGDYAKLDINGNNLTVESGGIIYSNGIIENSLSGGLVTVSEGGKLYTNFCVEDYRGGMCTSNKYDHNETPFIFYKIPYLICDVRVDYGAFLYGNCVLYALGNFNFIEEPLVGSNGLIELLGGYLIHANVSSKIDEYKERIDIYGDMKTNAMTMSFSFVNISIANVHFPITKYLDFNIYQESECAVNSKLKLLPGCCVNFYESSSLSLNAEVSMYQSFKPQSDFTSVANYTFYPDYGTYAPSYIRFNDSAFLNIPGSEGAGLSGRVIFNGGKDGCLESVISGITQKESSVNYAISTTEGIGYPSYVKLYDYNNFFDLYEIENSVVKCLYKRFQTYYFQYSYDEADPTSLTEVDMKTLNGNVVAKKEITDDDSTWDILTESSVFVSSGLIDEYIDDIVTISVTDTDGTVSTMIYELDEDDEYWTTVSGGKIVITYAGNNLVVDLYDEEKGIYTDGTNYYASFDGMFYKVALYEDGYIVKNTDLSTWYFYDTPSDFYGCTSSGWIQITSYTEKGHYFQINTKYLTDTYTETTGGNKYNHYYIIVEGKRQIIWRQIQTQDKAKTSGSHTWYPLIAYSATDADSPEFAYVEGAWLPIDSFDSDMMCASTEEGDRYLFLPLELQYKSVDSIVSDNGFYYAYLKTETIYDSIEYDFVLLVTEYESFLPSSNHTTRNKSYWTYGRSVAQDGVNKLIAYVYLSDSQGERNVLPLCNEDEGEDASGTFLCYSDFNDDILANYNADSDSFLYEYTPFTCSDTSSSIVSFSYAIKNTGTTLTLDGKSVPTFKNGTDIYVEDETNMIPVAQDSYGGYLSSDGYLYFANLGLNVYGDGFVIQQTDGSKEEPWINVKMQLSETYSGLYWSKLEYNNDETYGSNKYIIYAAVLADASVYSYSLALITDDVQSLDDLITDGVLKFWTSSTASTNYSVVSN